MSNDATRTWAERRHEAERAVDDPEGRTATCLHCGRTMSASDGVITADAAICDACNG